MMFLRSCFSRNLFRFEMKTDRRSSYELFELVDEPTKEFGCDYCCSSRDRKIDEAWIGSSDLDVRALVIDARDL